MDKTFVQHAENDVHRHQCRQDQPRLARQRALEGLRRALEVAADRIGHAQLALGAFKDAHRIAKGHARGQVERQVGGREQAVVADRQRPGTGRRHMGHGRQGHHFIAQGRTQVEVVEALGFTTLARIQFQNDLVLVGVGLELADLALAEGVVQCLVDVCSGQAETGGGLAVDVDARDAGPQLQVIGQVAQRRVVAQPLGQALGPQVERLGVVALEHVLVLGA